MSFYGGYGAWAPYVSVGERRRNAERLLAKLKQQGGIVSPVGIEGRKIATTIWGKAWCANLESYRDYASRLPRGRSYVRHGCVVDLQIAPREVKAIVSGSEIYNVTISIKPLAKPQWRSICGECASGIDSLIELLRGRLSDGVTGRLCRQEDGLFPRPPEIGFACTCPDDASMCKHVAAVLYGVGARLDAKPELLFRLRDVAASDLVANVTETLPLSRRGAGSPKVLEGDDIAGIFGLDMAAAAGEAKKPVRTQPRTGSRPAAAPVAASAKRASARRSEAGNDPPRAVSAAAKVASPRGKAVTVASPAKPASSAGAAPRAAAGRGEKTIATKPQSKQRRASGSARQTAARTSERLGRAQVSRNKGRQ